MGHVFTAWGGGIDLLKIIIDSLLLVQQADIELHLLVPDSGPVETAQSALRTIKTIIRNALRGHISLIKQFAPKAIVDDAFSDFVGQIKIHHIDAGQRAILNSADRLGLNVL